MLGKGDSAQNVFRMLLSRGEEGCVFCWQKQRRRGLGSLGLGLCPVDRS